MLYEFKIFGLKAVSLAITAPLLDSSLLYIIGKIQTAWKIGDQKKKFFALTMLMVFIGVSLGWLL
jgi:hypothetical protein